MHLFIAFSHIWSQILFELGVPPDIDEGSYVPQPPSRNMRVKIGTTVYVVDGFNVTIDCNVLTGTPPVNISWFRNGQPDLSGGNVTSINVTDANDNDTFTCRADNSIGFDMENTTVRVFGESNKTIQ